MHDAAVLGRPPPGADLQKFSEATARMQVGQKADLTKMIGAMRDLCRTPTEAKFLEINRLTHERETRTCLVSSNSYKQRFRRVDGVGPWVVVDRPSGSCGVVNVSRFERDARESGATFWKYFAKKVITNPRGEAMPRLPCTKLDEREYIYDWRSEEHFMRCDYIDLSAF
jgi:hypothetical protein